MPTKDLSKRLHRLQQGIYCAHCFVRIGPGERQVIRGEKAYHAQCEAKAGADAMGRLKQR